jgi:hypothetical protein
MAIITASLQVVSSPATAWTSMASSSSTSVAEKETMVFYTCILVFSIKTRGLGYNFLLF